MHKKNMLTSYFDLFYFKVIYKSNNNPCSSFFSDIAKNKLI